MVILIHNGNDPYDEFDVHSRVRKFKFDTEHKKLLIYKSLLDVIEYDLTTITHFDVVSNGMYYTVNIKDKEVLEHCHEKELSADG